MSGINIEYILVCINETYYLSKLSDETLAFVLTKYIKSMLDVDEKDSHKK